MLNDEQKLDFLSKINNKLTEFHGITSYEFELLNKIKLEQGNKDLIDYSINGNKKVGEENNSNEKNIENKIIQDKIKANIESILSFIKDKKEYEFITDFFINEYQNTSENIINHKESNLSQNSINSNLNDFENINEDFLTLFSNANLTDINSITKFNEEINKNKKLDIGKIHSFKDKKNSGIDLLLPKINPNEHKNNINGEQSKENMDKELEEEINKQIFGYVKKMKASARHFGNQLKKDNQTLNRIENLQNKVDDKTKKQIKRLEGFNYSIKLGFCKLMFLIFTVIGSFIGTMFVIKIFPKLA